MLCFKIVWQKQNISKEKVVKLVLLPRLLYIQYQQMTGSGALEANKILMPLKMCKAVCSDYNLDPVFELIVQMIIVLLEICRVRLVVPASCFYIWSVSCL